MRGASRRRSRRARVTRPGGLRRGRLRRAASAASQKGNRQRTPHNAPHVVPRLPAGYPDVPPDDDIPAGPPPARAGAMPGPDLRICRPVAPRGLSWASRNDHGPTAACGCLHRPMGQPSRRDLRARGSPGAARPRRGDDPSRSRSVPRGGSLHRPDCGGGAEPHDHPHLPLRGGPQSAPPGGGLSHPAGCVGLADLA